MAIRFSRWDLLEDGRTVPVLRIERDGALLSDAGGVDCFDRAITAAEAVWRLGGEHPTGASWIDVATEALGEAPQGTLSAGDHPRVLTSHVMAGDTVGWLTHAGHLSGNQTAEWGLLHSAVEAAGAPGTGDELPALFRKDGLEATDSPDAPPISGPRTSEWPFAGVAGKGEDTTPPE